MSTKLRMPKLWLVLGICLLVFAITAACGNNEEPMNETSGESVTTNPTTTPETKTTEPEPEPEKKEPAIDYSKEKAEIVIMDLGQGIEEQFNKSYGDYIREKFPNFTITFVQEQQGSFLQDLIVAGREVDIVYDSIENIGGDLFGTSSQFDMTELIKKHNIDLSKFDQTTINGIQSMGDGSMYFLPVTNMIQVLFYNKDIFNNLGVDYPKDGMTWEEAIALSQELTRTDQEQGIKYMGLSASPNHILRMNQFSVPVYDPETGKPTFTTDDRWKTLLQTYFMDINTPNFTDFVNTNQKLPYYTQMTNSHELAMMIFNSMFPFDGPQYVANLDWDLVSLPVFKDQPDTGSMASAIVFAITNQSRNKDAALEVIKYLTSTEMQTEYSKRGMITVLNDDKIKEVVGTESPFPDKNWKALYENNLADLSRKSIYDATILKFLTNDIPKLYMGQMDINTLLRSAQEQSEQYLKAEAQK